MHTRQKDSVSKTRYQLLKPGSKYRKLRKVGGDYLIDLLFEIGPGKASSFGLEPLSATELVAWQQGSENQLKGWEFSLLLDLSRIYVSSARSFEGSNELAPDLSPYEKGMQIKRGMESRVGKEVNV